MTIRKRTSCDEWNHIDYHTTFTVVGSLPQVGDEKSEYGGTKTVTAVSPVRLDYGEDTMHDGEFYDYYAIHTTFQDGEDTIDEVQHVAVLVPEDEWEDED